MIAYCQTAAEASIKKQNYVTLLSWPKIDFLRVENNKICQILFIWSDVRLNGIVFFHVDMQGSHISVFISHFDAAFAASDAR